MRIRFPERIRYLPWLPKRVLGRIDWYLFPELRGGKPFNAQAGREALFRELASRETFTAIVETGTFRGLTTAFMHTTTRLPVYTVESNERAFVFARFRFRDQAAIHGRLGDSREFLGDLLQSGDDAIQSALFYLDAHGYRDLPLRGELEMIDRLARDPLVMIDDFQVPDDPGYGFDDYGPGKRLVLDYLPPVFHENYQLYVPSLHSTEETGKKRGCLLACRRGSAHRLEEIALLRPISRSDSGGSESRG